MGQETHTIGIISDTHGLLRPEVAEVLAGCDAILHGGDVCQRSILRELERIAPVYAVRGNNDRDWEEPLPETLHVTLFGVSFYMIHDRKQIAEDVDGAEIVLFGHSHRFEAKAGGGAQQDGAEGKWSWRRVLSDGMKRKRTSGRALADGSDRERPRGEALPRGENEKRAENRDLAGSAAAHERQLWLNPGSCGPKRLRLPVTMALLEISENGACRIERLEIAPGGGNLRRETAAIREAVSGNLAGGAASGSWKICELHDEAPRNPEQNAGSPGSDRPPDGEEAEPAIPADIGVRIPGMIRDMKRGRPVAEIARRAGVSYEVAEQVCRMYATHPGVDVDGILRRLGL